MSSLILTLDRAAAHLAHARALRAEFSALFAESAALLRRSRRLCLFRRRMSGGSDLDTSSLAALIVTSPMCSPCLARRTDIPAERMVDTLRRLGSSVKLAVETARCLACLETTTVYGVTNGAGAGEGAQPRRATATREPVLWRFLESRRGEMFCSQCIAVALSATRRIDRAIFWAEGRGARRQHGRCASCGKDRLLCGLTR